MSFPDYSKNKLSALIPEQVPFYLRERAAKFLGHEEPKFVTFLQAYYNWLQSRGQVGDYLLRVAALRDIDYTIDEFVRYFRNEYLPQFPLEIVQNKEAFLVKHIKRVYRSKGDYLAFKFLFRLLYNEDIDVIFPRYLRSSDANWVVGKSIRVAPNTDSFTLADLENVKERRIVGQTSGLDVVAEDVVSFKDANGNTIIEILLNDRDISFRRFEIHESLLVVDPEDESGFLKTLANSESNVEFVVLPVLTGICVSDNPLEVYASTSLSNLNTRFSTLGEFLCYPGVNYSVGDRATIIPVSDNGCNGQAWVSKIGGGPIEQIWVDNGGTGYSVGDKVEAINDYLEIETYNGNFIVGETVSGDISGALAYVDLWDANNKRLWVTIKSGTFLTEDNSPYLLEAETITGQLSGSLAKLKKHRCSGGFGFEGYISSVGSSGNIESVAVKSSGQDYHFRPLIRVVGSGGSGANLIPFGWGIGRIESVDFMSGEFANLDGAGVGYYTPPRVVFDSRQVNFQKQVGPFWNDKVVDDVLTSQGGQFYRLCGDGLDGKTFEDITIDDLSLSNLTAVGIASVGTLVQYPGYFVGSDGLLDDPDKPLFDGEVNQDFSYQVRIGHSIEEWAEVVKKIIHPVGMKMLGFLEKVSYPAGEGVNEDSSSSINTYECYDKKVGAFWEDTLVDFIQSSHGNSFYDIVATGRFELCKVSDLKVSRSPVRDWSG